MEETKSTLVVQMPGWTGLANARVTIFGSVVQLPADLQASESGRGLSLCAFSYITLFNWLQCAFNTAVCSSQWLAKAIKEQARRR